MMIIGSETGSQCVQQDCQPPGIFYPVNSKATANELVLASAKYTRSLRQIPGLLELFSDRMIAIEGCKIYCLLLNNECYFGYQKNELQIWFKRFEDSIKIKFKLSGNKIDFINMINSLRSKCPQQNFLHKYQLQQKKGKGKHGQVYLASRKSDHQMFAIKIRQENAKFYQQINIVKELHHPNLIYLHQYFIQPDHTTYTVMDYQDGGSLLDKIYPRNTFTYKQKLKIVIDMLNALQFLRIHDIVHRDIKPQNILYSIKDNNYKLSDFSIAIKNGQKTNKISGTPGYLDPEILQQKNNVYVADIRSDIYAMGLTFYQIFTSNQYYQGSNTQQLLQKNQKSIPLKKREQKSPNMNKIQKKLLQKMIRRRQQNRKNSYQIMTSSIFNKITRLYNQQHISNIQYHNQKQQINSSDDQNIMATVIKIFKIKIY